MKSTRAQTDSCGSLKLPADALRGIHTARSLRFFNIGTQRRPLKIIDAMLHIKAFAQTSLQWRLMALAAAGLIGATAPLAQPARQIDASGDYRQEVEACRSGRTVQDRQTCLQEARNARAAAARGALHTPNADQMRANAMARCEGMANADMAACRARMMGYGTTSGSVGGGGMLRELEVVETQPGQESAPVAPKGDAPVLVVPAQGR